MCEVHERDGEPQPIVVQQSDLPAEPPADLLPSPKLLTPEHSPQAGTTGAPETAEGEAVKDSFNIVKITIWVLGAGVAFPWNAFISAPVYFEHFHEFTAPNTTLTSAQSRVWGDILLYFTISFSLMNVIGQGFVVWLGHSKEGDSPIAKRIVPATFAMSLVMFLVPILGWSSIAPMTTFGVLVAMTSFCGFCTAFLQATLFGLGALFPFEYQQLVMIGNSSSGLIVTIIRIMTKAYGGGRKLAGSIYCFSSGGWMLLCTACFFIMRNRAFARAYVEEFMHHWVRKEGPDAGDDRLQQQEALQRGDLGLGDSHNEFLSSRAVDYSGAEVTRRQRSQNHTTMSMPTASLYSTQSQPSCWKKIDREIGRHLQNRVASPMDASDIAVSPSDGTAPLQQFPQYTSQYRETPSVGDPIGSEEVVTPTAGDMDRDLLLQNSDRVPPPGVEDTPPAEGLPHPAGHVAAAGGSRVTLRGGATRPSVMSDNPGSGQTPQRRGYIGVRRSSAMTPNSEQPSQLGGEKDFLIPGSRALSKTSTVSRTNTARTDREFMSRVRKTKDGVINDDFIQWADDKLVPEDDLPAHTTMQIFWTIRKMAFTVWFCFTLSLSLFPGVVSRIPSSLSDGWFTIWLIFLFNLFDSIGRIVPHFYSLGRQGTFIFAFIRIAFAPALILCAIDDTPREVLSAGLVSAMALTNGYIGSLCMMYGPAHDDLNRGDRQLAGTIMSFCLLLGLTCGSFLGLLICNWVPDNSNSGSTSGSDDQFDDGSGSGSLAVVETMVATMLGRLN